MRTPSIHIVSNSVAVKLTLLEPVIQLRVDVSDVALVIIVHTPANDAVLRDGTGVCLAE